MVGDPCAVAVRRAPDRRRRIARGRVGARQGARHPIRAAGARRGLAPRRRRAVAWMRLGVRADARGVDPNGAVVHDPRRHQRDPTNRRREGATGMSVLTDALRTLRDDGPSPELEIQEWSLPWR